MYVCMLENNVCMMELCESFSFDIRIESNLLHFLMIILFFFFLNLFAVADLYNRALEELAQ